jgi:hypothetical protein
MSNTNSLKVTNATEGDEGKISYFLKKQEKQFSISFGTPVKNLMYISENLYT